MDNIGIHAEATFVETEGSLKERERERERERKGEGKVCNAGTTNSREAEGNNCIIGTTKGTILQQTQPRLSLGSGRYDLMIVFAMVPTS